ncbi:hypothetical protein [Legionella sp. W05-934-2]|uniref:hypothetical protein n=1 Tax=Legionella sp. W05-934-2 TaxID=1198649 RepID=UPI003461F7C7
MATIKIHVLDFHSIFTHIEIVLENTSTTPHTFYGINRWEEPGHNWVTSGPNAYIDQASSTFSFDIEADPKDIVKQYRDYWYSTDKDAGILSLNCGDTAQWFLSKYARIPKPNLSNISWNHFALGIIWPSFIPCPITIPGRVMANAKFHVNARNNPEETDKYSRLFLYTCMAAASLLIATSVFALVASVTILSAGLAALAIGGCALAGLVGTYGFFKAYNQLSAKNIADKLKNPDESFSADPSSNTPVEHPDIARVAPQ